MFALDAFLDSFKSVLKFLFIIFASAAIAVALLGCDDRDRDDTQPAVQHVEVDQLPAMVVLKTKTGEPRWYEGLIVFESFGDGVTILAERNKAGGGNWVKTLTPVDFNTCDLDWLIVEPPWLRPRLLECGEDFTDRVPEMEPWE